MVAWTREDEDADDAGSESSYIELSFGTPTRPSAPHQPEAAELRKLRADVALLHAPVTEQGAGAHRERAQGELLPPAGAHSSRGAWASNSSSLSPPGSPGRARTAKLPYAVRLLDGRAVERTTLAFAPAAAPVPASTAVRTLSAEPRPPIALAPARLLDMGVPSLLAAAPASPLRLLSSTRNTAPAPPACSLSVEAAQLRNAMEAAVAAAEARLRATLGEALRASSNLRLASHPPLAVTTPGVALQRAAERAAAETRAQSVVAVPAFAAVAELTPLARAEAEDPFVALWVWALGRPARLADLWSEAASPGCDGLSRAQLTPLLCDTLLPTADARALRYVTAMLDALEDAPVELLTVARFVACVREGAQAGEQARRTFSGGVTELMERMARSMDAQIEAWAFQFHCAEGGALALPQLMTAATALMPGLPARSRALLAAQMHAEGSFGGPRTRFTMLDAREMCRPRADRLASRAKNAAARASLAAKPAERARPPPAMVLPVAAMPSNPAAQRASGVPSAAEAAALRAFADAAAAVPRLEPRPPPPAPVVVPPRPPPAPPPPPPIVVAQRSEEPQVQQVQPPPTMPPPPVEAEYALPPVRASAPLDLHPASQAGPPAVPPPSPLPEPPRRPASAQLLRAAAEAAQRVAQEAEELERDCKLGLHQPACAQAQLRRGRPWKQ